MKRYLLTAEASALLQEHLLPCHLDGAIGTCPPGGPGIPRVDWSTQMAPLTHKHKWQNFKRKKGKIQFLSCKIFRGWLEEEWN